MYNRDHEGFAAWKQRARQLKVEVYALYLAYRDPRVPWYAEVFAACIVGYAFSPIDLIPDFIPVLGYLGELVLLPLAVLAARWMIPAPVLADCRARAHQVIQQGRPVNRTAATVIIGIWLLLVAVGVWLMLRWVGPGG